MEQYVQLYFIHVNNLLRKVVVQSCLLVPFCHMQVSWPISQKGGTSVMAPTVLQIYQTENFQKVTIQLGLFTILDFQILLEVLGQQSKKMVVFFQVLFLQMVQDLVQGMDGVICVQDLMHLGVMQSMVIVKPFNHMPIVFII